MIIDFHCHVGEDRNGEKQSLEELKKSMDRFGIDKCVVFPFSSEDSQELIESSLILLKESKDKDWIIPFLRFNPNDISKEKLVRLLGKGFRGVKLHPTAQKFNPSDKKYEWIFSLISDKRLPILFHSRATDMEYAHPKFILNLAKKFPSLNIVIAHFFGGYFRIIDEVRKLNNVYVDTSIDSRTLRIKQCFTKHNYDRLLLASDAPYDNQGVALMKIRESELSNEDQQKILLTNAKKILEI